MTQKIDLLMPVGRMVGGNMYEPQTKDADGRPLTIKTGPNIGQPTVKYWFAVAYKKTPGITHWGNELGWGQQIWNLGQAFFPGVAMSPTFSWKIDDGDSQIPSQPTAKNPMGTKPCDRDGYPGHWVVNFSSQFAPKIVNANGSAYLLEKDYVKPGHFIQVHCSVDGNGQVSKPGVYINHNFISHQAFGQEIIFGRDPGKLGFGGQALPAGASAVPMGQPSGQMPLPGVPGQPPGYAAPPGAAMPPQYAPPVYTPPQAPGAGPIYAAPPGYPPPGAPAAPPLPPAPPGPPPAAPLPPFVPPTAVQPSAPFIAPPAAPPPPSAPPPPAAGPQMTAAAQSTYAGYRASGWSDEQLRAAGLMV